MEKWKCAYCEEEYRRGHNVGIVKSNFPDVVICVKCYNKGLEDKVKISTLGIVTKEK